MTMLLTQQAAKYFLQGNYKKAHDLYKDAEKVLGPKNVKANLLLCQKRLKNKKNTPVVSLSGRGSASEEVHLLNQEIIKLNNELEKKDITIQERFQELAILTKLLEEK
ncbi:hypothetical protein GCM10011502_19530 [Oceanisphaera marina]|uniref:Tetratricopeptide repeat protein n=1 Tax=Oceanisphaera marina TaxID=2017550 RepID=A0ABQ1ILL5_9GAMM|nr:hypothetical protein [Oceanisphaera marina]GGB46266.1 hypothetical protein GCM10011502_19530 [Oceanisphaera marina]